MNYFPQSAYAQGPFSNALAAPSTGHQTQSLLSLPGFRPGANLGGQHTTTQEMSSLFNSIFTQPAFLPAYFPYSHFAPVSLLPQSSAAVPSATRGFFANGGSASSTNNLVPVFSGGQPAVASAAQAQIGLQSATQSQAITNSNQPKSAAFDHANLSATTASSNQAQSNLNQGIQIYPNPAHDAGQNPPKQNHSPSQSQTQGQQQSQTPINRNNTSKFRPNSANRPGQGQGQSNINRQPFQRSGPNGESGNMGKRNLNMPYSSSGTYPVGNSTNAGVISNGYGSNQKSSRQGTGYGGFGNPSNSHSNQSQSQGYTMPQKHQNQSMQQHSQQQYPHTDLPQGHVYDYGGFSKPNPKSYGGFGSQSHQANLRPESFGPSFRNSAGISGGFQSNSSTSNVRSNSRPSFGNNRHIANNVRSITLSHFMPVLPSKAAPAQSLGKKTLPYSSGGFGASRNVFPLSNLPVSNKVNGFNKSTLVPQAFGFNARRTGGPGWSNLGQGQASPSMTTPNKPAVPAELPKEMVELKALVNKPLEEEKIPEDAKRVRFYVIKSFTEDDVFRCLKYSRWCSTERGNQTLDQGFREVNPELFGTSSENGTPVGQSDAVLVGEEANQVGAIETSVMTLSDPSNEPDSKHSAPAENTTESVSSKNTFSSDSKLDTQETILSNDLVAMPSQNSNAEKVPSSVDMQAHSEGGISNLSELPTEGCKSDASEAAPISQISSGHTENAEVSTLPENSIGVGDGATTTEKSDAQANVKSEPETGSQVNSASQDTPTSDVAQAEGATTIASEGSSADRKGRVYLFFSVNQSGYFNGVGEMLSAVDYSNTQMNQIWEASNRLRWRGSFALRWVYVKDVPHNALRHVILPNNEYKPITHSRDTQLVPYAEGVKVMEVFARHEHKTTLFDDFAFFEESERRERERALRMQAAQGQKRTSPGKGRARTSPGNKEAASPSKTGDSDATLTDQAAGCEQDGDGMMLSDSNRQLSQEEGEPEAITKAQHDQLILPDADAHAVQLDADSPQSSLELVAEQDQDRECSPLPDTFQDPTAEGGPAKEENVDHSNTDKANVAQAEADSTSAEGHISDEARGGESRSAES